MTVSLVVVATYLRTQGKALKTEMMMNTLVIIPLTMTAGCWMARYRTMSTILYTSQLTIVLALLFNLLQFLLTQSQKAHTLSECHLHVAGTKSRPV
jgi:hypothetical protein